MAADTWERHRKHDVVKVISKSGNVKIDLFTGAGFGDNTMTAGAADRLRLFGDITIASGSLLTLINPNLMTLWANGDIWRLFDVTSIGTVTGIFTLDYTGLGLDPLLGIDTSNLYTSGTIAIIGIPEPSRAVLFLFGLLALVSRRRRRAVIG